MPRHLAVVVFLLLISVAIAPHSMAKSVGSPLTLRASMGHQRLAYTDEITSPVRWQGQGLRWSVQAEAVVGNSTVRGGYRRAEPRVDLDGAAMVDTVYGGGYYTVNAFTGRHMVLEDAWLDVSWPVTDRSKPQVELGAFIRLRAEYHGDTTHDTSHGFVSILVGPLARYRWEPAPSTEVYAEGSVNLVAWVLRTPYLGYDADWIWQDEISFHTARDFVHGQLRAGLRHGVGRHLAVEAAVGLEYTWTRLERSYRSVYGLAELGIVVGI